MTDEQSITPSCGCVFCDLRLPMEEHNGIKGHWTGKDKETFVPCPISQGDIEEAFNRFFGL